MTWCWSVAEVARDQLFPTNSQMRLKSFPRLGKRTILTVERKLLALSTMMLAHLLSLCWSSAVLARNFNKTALFNVNSHLASKADLLTLWITQTRDRTEPALAQVSL